MSQKKCCLSFVVVLSFALVFAACEGPVGPAGPPGADGRDGVDGVDGVDGNANVTLYIFPGHDFSVASSATRTINISSQAAHASAWLVYLLRGTNLIYHIPGPGVDNFSQYRVFMRILGASTSVEIRRASGPGEEYTQIRVIRIEASDIVEPTSASSLIPEDLDVRDYHAVARYYGLE